MKNYRNITEGLQDLQGRGYTAQFESQTVCLYCGDLDLRLDTNDYTVEENHIIDDYILLAIRTSSGIRGTLLEAYGSCSLSK